MNILMVNPVHPTTRHISAVRAWRFAQELALLGHRVVLLTVHREGQPLVDAMSMGSHDWRQPFVLACEYSRPAARTSVTLSGPFRKAATVWRMLRYGGKLSGWTVSAVQAAEKLSEQFKTDVVWCTFGMMEAVMTAKRFAAGVGCPWVLDIKDNWELYVPRGLRRLMVWRTRGWSVATANARFTAGKARKWQRTNATIIYSGVDEAFFERDPIAEQGNNHFVINLVGSLYFRDHLGSFLKAVGTWVESLAESNRSSVLVRYMGGDVVLFEETARRFIPGIRIVAEGYLDLDNLAHFCRNAAINAYIAHSGTFHHKLLELLACGRPIVAYPKERDESRELVRLASGDLIEVGDLDQLATKLTGLYQSWTNGAQGPASPDPVRRYAWSHQAKQLERFLLEVSL